ncbi:hypothetical protein C3L33_14918, partial [Rhododendron williamsianum]
MDSCSKSLRDSSPFDCLLFDLDETLYPSALGIGQATKRNIDDFLVEKCGFPVTQAPTLRVELFKTYGSSLAGLRLLGYDIDADDYHRPSTSKPFAQHQPKKNHFYQFGSEPCDEGIRSAGNQRLLRKNHMLRDIESNLSKSTRPDEFPVVLKPSLEAFRIAIDVAEIDPRHTLFLDDSLRNVAAGKALGLRTAMVGKSGKFKEADYALENINSLAQAIPEIWFGEGETENHRLSRTRSQIEPVHATASVGA